MKLGEKRRRRRDMVTFKTLGHPRTVYVEELEVVTHLTILGGRRHC